MLTLNKISTVLAPALNKARQYYDSTRSTLAWIDEKGYSWWFGEQRCALASDLSPSASTTLADVTGLAFSVVAGVTYKFEFSLIYRSAATTTGIKIGLTCPASPTYLAANVSIFGRAADAAGTAVFFGTIKASGDSVVSDTVEEASVDYEAIVRGTLVNVTDGSLQLQWATEVGASGVTPKAGSAGRLWIP